MAQQVIFAFALLLAALSGSSFADPVESELLFYCNQSSGAFFLSSDPAEQPSPSARYKKRSIDWTSLLKMGPQTNAWGDPLRSGSRKAIKKCGPITATFSSGFLNTNPQGELGALDFPVVEIRKGNKVLLAPTALEQCDIQLSRYNYFGACPDSWAQLIEVLPTSGGHLVQVKRVFTDEAYKEVSRTDVY